MTFWSPLSTLLVLDGLWSNSWELRNSRLFKFADDNKEPALGVDPGKSLLADAIAPSGSYTLFLSAKLIDCELYLPAF